MKKLVQPNLYTYEKSVFTLTTLLILFISAAIADGHKYIPHKRERTRSMPQPSWKRPMQALT